MKAFEQALHKDHHVRRFEILVDTEGWRVVDSSDTTVLRDVRFTDWHRVERARRAFSIETQSLRAEGWREAV